MKQIIPFQTLTHAEIVTTSGYLVIVQRSPEFGDEEVSILISPENIELFIHQLELLRDAR